MGNMRAVTTLLCVLGLSALCSALCFSFICIGFKSYNDAKHFVENKKKEYGNGVSTLVIVHNGLDKDLVLEESHSEHGSFYASPVTIPAGEYDAFLHTKTAWAALGSKGYVRYSYVAYTYFEGSGPIQENKKNIYFGWDTPWSGTNKFGVRISDDELTKSQKGTMMSDLNKNYQHYVKHYEYKTRDYKLTPIVEIKRDESSPLLYYSITRTRGNFLDD